MRIDLQPIQKSEELALLRLLDTAVHDVTVRMTLTQIVQRVFDKLAADPSAVMAWEDVPLDIYGGAFPCQIQSSWVFILRAGATTGAERHPNSHQRVMSFQGIGDLQTGGYGRWRSHLLVSDRGANLGTRWLSIPPNEWHQAVVPNQDWVVVSFHTVPAPELIEERPDRLDSSRTCQRKYVVPR